MASALKIEINSAVGGLIGALVDTGDTGLIGELRHAMGSAIADELRTHFEKLESERSGQSGGQPSHFWMQVRDSVQQPRTAGDDIVIGIQQKGFRQRLEGGVIEAGKGVSSATGEPTKFIAIPVDVDSYGKRPGDFPTGALQYVVLPSGPALILAEHTDRIATKGAKKGKAVAAKGDQVATHGAGSIMFLLRDKVFQKADPSVLPPEQEIIDTALRAGDQAAELFLSRRADNVTAGNH